MAAANATKNGDQYASLAKDLVSKIIWVLLRAAFLYILSATKISDERFITEPNKCTPKYVFKKDFSPFGSSSSFVSFGVATSLRKPTPIRSVIKYWFTVNTL